LKSSQLKAMIDEDHGAELTCNFCGNKYHYTEDELKEILAKKKDDKDY
jgi:Disulfide bond chaperones of the HSP33 family